VPPRRGFTRRIFLDLFFLAFSVSRVACDLARAVEERERSVPIFVPARVRLDEVAPMAIFWD
jgi:hypothetical protein